jgi:CHAT domain-containing protein/Flp pilus assembly protein TadD
VFLALLVTPVAIADSNPEATAPRSPGMRVAFDDDFKTDTRRSYFTGLSFFTGSTLGWEPGKLLVRSGVLIRSIPAAPTAELEAQLTFPPLTKDREAETDFIFLVKDGPRAVATLRRECKGGKVTAEARIMFWPSTHLLPTVLRRFPLPGEVPGGKFTARYQRGLITLDCDGRRLAIGYLPKNDDAPVIGVTLNQMGMPTTCSRLTSRVLTAPPSLSEEQRRILREASQSFHPILRLKAALVEFQRLEVVQPLYGLAIPLILGDGSLARGYLPEAKGYYKELLEATRSFYGSQHPKMATGLNNVASRLYPHGEHQLARRYCEEALDIVRAVLGEQHLEFATVLNNLACLEGDSGDTRRSEALHLRVMDIRKQLVGTDHPAYGNSLNNLAEHYLTHGEYARAEPLLQEARRLYRKQGGRVDSDYGSVMHNLAVLQIHLGQYERAEVLLKEAIAVLRRTNGNQNPRLAQFLGTLAHVYIQLRRVDLAERHYLLSIDTFRRAGAHRNVGYSTSRTGLAWLYACQGKFARAASLYRETLTDLGQTLGDDHPYSALVRGNLATLYFSNGDLVEAEAILRQASITLDKALGMYHPYSAQTLDLISEACVLQGRWAEAAEMADCARRRFRWLHFRVLPALSDLEQLFYLTRLDSPSLRFALTLATSRPDDPLLARLSACWLLNAKAVAQQTLAERTLLARDQDGDRGRKTLRELLDVRGRLARLALKELTPSDGPNFRQELDRLVEQEEALSKKLGRIGGATTTDPWVELSAVRAALPPDGILIEIAKFSGRNFKAKTAHNLWEEPRYVAWLIPPATGGDIQVIDLGDAAKIDRAVQDVRSAFQEAPAVLTQVGTADAETRVRRPLEALGRLLLDPLFERLKKYRTWVVSPDGALWMFPWEALPLSSSRYAIEDHAIRYIVSGRSLVQASSGEAEGTPVLFADPDFDLEDAVANGPRPRPSDKAAPRWQPLPGTADEAKQITPLLTRLAPHEPDVFLQQFAREETFKKLRQPRILLMSTHGMFLDDPQRPRAPPSGLTLLRGIFLAPRQRPTSSARQGDGVPIGNPLLRCGLVLAGANRGDRAAGSGEDGILTGLEIVGTDLRGTDLVVLSACDTGLGQVRDGEGVASLRQAFQLAGARTVVSTLWKVPDAETAELMTAYFENLAAGWSKADALRRAQLALVESQRARHGAAHPLFWAGFTLTGDPGPSRRAVVPKTSSPSSVESPAAVPEAPSGRQEEIGLVVVGLVVSLGACGLAWRRWIKRVKRPHPARPIPAPVSGNSSAPSPLSPVDGGRLAPPRATSYQFLCPGCGSSLRARSEHVGKQTSCPSCRLRMRVPPAGP